MLRNMFDEIKKCNHSLDCLTQILTDVFTETVCVASKGVIVILTTVLSVPGGNSMALLGGEFRILGGVTRAAGVVPAPGAPPAVVVVPVVGGCKYTSLSISENQMTKFKSVCHSRHAIDINV